MPIAIPSIERTDRRRWPRRAPEARRRRSRTGSRSPPQSAATGSSRVARRGGQDAEEQRPPRSRDENAATTAQTGGVRGKRGVDGDEQPDRAPAHERGRAARRRWRGARPPRGTRAGSGRRPTPTAFRRPISRVRSETETSITFMIPTPATASENAAMPARARVSTQDRSEGAEHRVLGDDGDVLLAVALRDQADDALHRAVEIGVGADLERAGGRATVRLNIASRSPPARRPRRPCRCRAAGPAARGRRSPACASRPPGRSGRAGSGREELAPRTSGPRTVTGQLRPPRRGEEAAAADREPPDLEHLVRRSDHGHLATPLSEGHRLGAHDDRRGALDLGHAPEDGPSVLQGEVVRDPAHARHAAGRLGLAGQDDEQVGADVANSPVT